MRSALQRELTALATDGDPDARRRRAAVTLRDALLKTQAEDIERARANLDRTRAVLAAHDALAATASDADAASWRARARDAEGRLAEAQAQGGVADLLAARATIDDLNLDLARRRHQDDAATRT